MSEKDIRWIQRLNNYIKAFEQLKDAVSLANQKELSNLEKQGLVQAFEFTHELAWNVMKDYFSYQGESSIFGSRDASRMAFNRGLISDGHVWMEMIDSRNKTSHTYDEEIIEEIYGKIINYYFTAFEDFKQTMQQFKEKEGSQ